MEIEAKKLKLIEEIKTKTGYSVEAIETKNKFDGIWFLVDGFECIILTNEENRYADNNIVDGTMKDSFEVEEYELGYLYSNS